MWGSTAVIGRCLLELWNSGRFHHSTSGHCLFVSTWTVVGAAPVWKQIWPKEGAVPRRRLPSLCRYPSLLGLYHWFHFIQTKARQHYQRVYTCLTGHQHHSCHMTSGWACPCFGCPPPPLSASSCQIVAVIFVWTRLSCTLPPWTCSCSPQSTCLRSPSGFLTKKFHQQ